MRSRVFRINMVFFTTPELLEIGGHSADHAVRETDPGRGACATTGRSSTHSSCRCRCSKRVTAVQSPDGSRMSAFAVETETVRGARRASREARNVVLAMGYYELPNMLNVPGEDSPHVSHFYTEAHPFYRRRVVIVAAARIQRPRPRSRFIAPAGHVTMVHRGPGFGESVKYWVKPDIENRVEGGIDCSALQFRRSRRFVRPKSCSIPG